MADTGLLDRNLIALNTRHSELAAELSGVRSHPELSVIHAREGSPVPVLQRDGRPYPMHSRFDPVSEGRRLSDEAPDGFLVAFGLGGGYHLTPLLQKTTVTGLMIIEHNLSMMRGILEQFDLTKLLSDSRVVVLMDPSPDELNRIILDRYLPVLYGNLGSITLRSRWDADPTWFSERADALRGLPESLGRDYTVQSRFGRRWFVHTMLNLSRSEEVRTVLSPARHLLVTAAGPSLEAQIPEIMKKHSEGAVLLATDTSLPMLTGKGIVPDMVLSIDCQVVSYHHFFKGLPESTVLILDLASPPVLTRQTDNILFFSSGHPFSLYLNRLYRPFPILDLSGGNVTHAAMSLARAVGSREVFLYGADFSYPAGQPYARGTYIYPYFQSRSQRASGSEHLFWQFIRNSRPKREQVGESWRYRTSSMDHYRESLEKTVEMLDFELIPGKGSGVPISPGAKKNHAAPDISNRFAPMLSAGPVTIGWKEFLNDYAGRLEALPPLNGPPQDYLEDLGTENRQAWATLLPSAATFRSGTSDGPQAVEEARMWTLERIRRVPR